MFSIKNTVMTKIIAILLCIVMLVGLIPVGIFSAFASEDAKMGSLSCITENGVLTNASGDEAKATFSNMTLNWDPADPSVARYADGWWVGVKMTAPSNLLTEEDCKDVTYQRCTSKVNDTWSSALSFWEAQDSNKNTESTERYMTLWGLVNEQYLNDAIVEGKNITYTWRFDWNGDGEYEQKATIEIEPDTIKLNKDNVQIYPSSTGMGTVSPLSEGIAVETEPSTNVVKVKFAADTVLKWVKANPEITRYDDGWWAGIKVTAPSNLKEKADFENVTYQNKSGNSWGEVKDFWSRKDSADNAAGDHYIGLWGLLNVDYLTQAAQNGKSFRYIWRFDWNADKVYEQIIVIEIDPGKITLVDENDNQVYPEMGTVTPITNGVIVEGSGTYKVTASADELDLEWSDKDENTGRSESGWWAGIQVTAPDDISIDDLDDVKYQTYKDGKWTEDKSLDMVKDGKLQLWMLLDRTMLKQKKITSKWRFDWNGDGNKYEQVITFEIDPSKGGIKLNRVACPDFGFVGSEAASEVDVWLYEKTYSVEARSEKSKGKVTYSLNVIDGDADIATIDEKGLVTFNDEGKVGTITVVASIDEDDVYESASVKRTINIIKKNILNFTFEQPKELIYKENLTFTNEIKVNTETSTVIKYKVTSGNDYAYFKDENNPTLTIVKPGTIVVRAYREEDKYYKSACDEYTLVVDRGVNEADFAQNTSSKLTYSSSNLYDPFDEFKIVNNSVKDNAVRYSISEVYHDVATMDETSGFIKTVKPGKFVLDVTIPGNVFYNTKELSKEITVVKADREGFVFADESKSFTVVYNDNGNEFENMAAISTNDEMSKDVLAVIEALNKSVVYSITEGDSAVIENAESPVVTIKKAGDVVVRATLPGDEYYNDCVLEYTLKIEKAEQTFGFEFGNTVVKNYGLKEFYNAPVPTEVKGAADGKGYGTGEYTIFVEANKVGAAEGKDGKVIFSDSNDKVGTVTVTVEKAEDECYKSAMAYYTIEIKFFDGFPEVTVNKELNDNGWYNEDIVISAPDKHMISFDNELSTDNWAKEVSYDVEGTTVPVVYLKDENGNISKEIVLSDYKMDKSAPTNLDINYGGNLLSTVQKDVYDIKAEKTTVTITARDEKDTDSGIDYVEYSTDGGFSYTRIEFKSQKFVETKFDINAQYRGKVLFRVADMAGNISKFNYSKDNYTEGDRKYGDDKTIVIDTKVPEVFIGDLGYQFYGTHHEVTNGVVYTNGAVKVVMSLRAENADLSGRPTVKLNNALQRTTWVQSEDFENLYEAELSIIDDGDYELTVTFTDRLGRSTNFTKKIRVDGISPQIPEVNTDNSYVISPGNVKTSYDKRMCYDVAQNITFTIIDHNFDAGRVDLVLSAKNYAGDDIDLTSKMYSDYVQDPENWVHEGDKHTLKGDGLKFDVDANYTLSLVVTDYAGNTTTSENALLFTVDTASDKPADPVITYSKDAVWAIIENITFGFFKAPIDVKISSSDKISGLKYIEYSYVGTTGIYVSDIVEVSGSDETEDTIQFTIPGSTQFKGIISATAYDRSLNKSETVNVGYDFNGIELGGIVLDNIEPKRVVELSEANRVVSADTLKDIEEYDFTSENEEVILYYSDKATITFNVTEANFFEEEVEITVNGIKNNPDDWKLIEGSSTWVGTITLEDAGDYIVKMSYTDKSGNVMDEYVSGKIVIDHTDPTINVAYDVNEYVNEFDGRQYFDKNRTATVTIKEHNFRADDAVITVYAKDVEGKDLTSVGSFTFDKNGAVKEYMEAGCDRNSWSQYMNGSWRRNDDEYKLTLNFTEDANYTLNVSYVDLATRESAEFNDNLFTVDKTNPEYIGVGYSAHVFEDFLEDITFGFYNAQMTVTITAQDDISGVHRFVYSYLKSENVSNVNAELIDEVIVYDKLTKSASVEFKVPKLALREDNQFKGTVEFTAYDRSENVSEKFADENKVIVVDNIKPTHDVDIPDGIKVGDVDYYANSFDVEVTINEANFYEEDFSITVTKDGANYPIRYSWNEVNLDTHTTTFPLREDGDYIITVEGKDKSGNVMDTYVSNQRTIDTTKPEIRVVDVMHESANNDETVSFTVEAVDKNISSFKPVLTAIIKEDKENNQYEFTSVNIPLGNGVRTTVGGNNVITYFVENLVLDGYYSLICSAEDHAGNSESVISSKTTENTTVEVDTVNFSINREGSVFWLETEHNDKYSGETFVNELNGAYANDKVTVRLHEINVDEVDLNNDKKTIFTLNDGSSSDDITLNKGKNYTKNSSVADGGWYKTSYNLSNDNFDHDGVYSLNVITYDKADNVNVNTKFEESTISFVVDRTNPIVSANVKSNHRVNDTQFWVQFKVNETNLDPGTIKVNLRNNDGKTVKTDVESLGNNEYKFLVKSGFEYSFDIVAKDLAGNESEIYKVERLTVSTNIFVLWYANKPLFWGSIGGAVLLAGLTVVLGILKKKKK